MAHIGGQSHLAERHLLVSAFNREGAILEINVVNRRFHHGGGNALGLGFNLVQGFGYGRHADRT